MSHPRLLSFAAAALALLIAVAGAPPAARAAGDRDAQKAAEHFSLAEAAEKRGDWETAILEYKRAHALKPHPSVLYNIAVDYEKLADWENAAEYYQRYLDDSGRDAGDRAEVEPKIAELRERARQQRASRPRPGAGAGRLVVRANLDGASVKIDGVLAGQTPLEIDVPAGPHRILIEAPGHRAARRDVEVGAGGTEEIREYLAPDGSGTGPGGEPGAAARPRFAIGMDFGFGILDPATVFTFGLNLRGASGRYEVGVYYGLVARNDRALGVDARLLLSDSAWKPFVRAAATVGSATLDLDTYRTYGADVGGGLLYSMAYGPMPNGRSALTLEYYLGVNARFTAGGVGEMVGTELVPDESQTVPFQVIVDVGLWYRF